MADTPQDGPRAGEVPEDQLPKDVFDDPGAAAHDSQHADPIEGSIS